MRHKHEHTPEGWFNTHWRPMMGWVYTGICIFDFVLAPIVWTILQGTYHGTISQQWQPLTLQGGGLFHVAMGAIVGITSYSKSKERIGAMEFGSSTTTTYAAAPAGVVTGYKGKPAPVLSPDPEV